jgi:N6-adenosine-specific RNA methylase IME4
MTWPFGDLERGKYGAILADPPWSFEVWSGKGTARSAENHYSTMTMSQISRLPVDEIAADNCALFMWCCWPSMPDALRILQAWGFAYKTCAFSWMKADPYRLFADDATPFAGMGYWTRANTEPCLLATRGKPKRLNADVRQGIIAPRREHSRKPDGIHERIQRLVAGPYCELFARQRRPGWDVWGNQTDKFAEAAE